MGTITTMRWIGSKHFWCCQSCLGRLSQHSCSIQMGGAVIVRSDTDREISIGLSRSVGRRKQEAVPRLHKRLPMRRRRVITPLRPARPW